MVDEATIANLLRDCEATTWREKRTAVHLLGDHLQDPRVFSRLVDALDDEDLGVVDVAAEVLAVQGGTAGLEILASTFATTEDAIGYTINERLMNVNRDHGVAVTTRLADISRNSPDSDVRQGAAELIERLPPDQR